MKSKGVGKIALAIRVNDEFPPPVSESPFSVPVQLRRDSALLVPIIGLSPAPGRWPTAKAFRCRLESPNAPA